MALLKVALICLLVHLCSGDTTRIELERNILDKILSGYNKELRPPGDHATNVTVNAYIRDIFYVCEKSHQWKTQLTFRSEWNDPRLAYNVDNHPEYKHLSLTSKQDVWTPDLFFSNEVEATSHNVPQGNTFVRIHPNGDVLYSTRISLTLTCPAGGSVPGELSCPIRIASYGYTTCEVALKWMEKDPVQFNPKIALTDFAVKEATTGHAESTTNTGKYDSLTAKVHLQRAKCTA